MKAFVYALLVSTVAIVSPAEAHNRNAMVRAAVEFLGQFARTLAEAPIEEQQIYAPAPVYYERDPDNYAPPVTYYTQPRPAYYPPTPVLYIAQPVDVPVIPDASRGVPAGKPTSRHSGGPVRRDSRS